MSGLHRRTGAEGDDTDYAAALAQAMNYLGPGTPYSQQSPSGSTKAIFLMTDGGLDVHRDPQYLPDWLPAARHAVDLQLAAAQAANVQVWPLGFGSISPPDQQYLDHLATGGTQSACDSREVSRPHATVVQNPSDALDALDALYAAAGCFGTSKSGPVPINAGQSRTLQVSIPAIASDVAISVRKGNPAIRVDYVTPDGATVTGSSRGGSTFQRSGQDTAVDVLHVTDPAPGTWQIRLTAPPGLGQQLVSATAFWQGSVRAVITAYPPSAKDGQPVKVVVSVLGANGPVTDPATLQQIQVGVSVTGDGVPGRVNVPVSNAGEGKGTATGAGDYTGSFTAPDRRSQLTFVGTAQGYGLHTTEVPTTVQVGGPAPLLQAAIQFNAPPSVLPGQSVSGQIVFSNQTGAAQQVRLALSASPAFATVTSLQGTLRVPSGDSPVSFTIAFGRNSPRGSVLVRASIVDAANPTTVYGNSALTFTVTSPPGILARYGWAIAGAVIALLLIILLVLARRRAHLKAIEVRGLSAVLHRDSERVGPTLKASGRRSDAFRFVIRDEDGPRPRLAHARPGDRAYVARRASHGRVKVETPSGEKFEVSANTDGEPLLNGLTLAFADARLPSVRAARDHTFAGADPEPAGGVFPPAPRTPAGDQLTPEPMAPAPADPARDSDDWL